MSARSAAATRRPWSARISGSLLPSSSSTRQGRRSAAEPVGERVGEGVARRRRLDDRQQLVRVRREGRPAGGRAQRLRDAPAGPGGQHRTAPDQRLRVGQAEREVLGRVLRGVGQRRAVARDLVHRVGDAVGDHGRAEVHPVQRGQRDDGGGQRVAGGGRQQDRRGPARVLGDDGGGRAGDEQQRPAAYGLVDGGHDGGRRDVAGHHDDQVERPDPARQAVPGPGDEGHRADGLEDGADEAGLAARGDHRPGAREPTQPVERLVRVGGLAADPGAGLGEPPDDRVDPRQRVGVVEGAVVEDRHAAAPLRPRRRTGATRLVDQQHRDAVADRVGQAAVRGLAHQLVAVVVDRQRSVAVRAGQDLQQLGSELDGHDASCDGWDPTVPCG